MYKAIILDRDGTLNHTTQILRPNQTPDAPTDGYVLNPAELRLFDTVKPALTLLRQNGLTPFVFTQQNCIGKGLVTLEGVSQIHAHINEQLGDAARVEAFYVAYSTPSKPEDLRCKPNPTMIFEIMEDYNLQASDILVMGDSKRDYKAALAAGVDFIWIRDDLNRVTDADMAKTGCPIFNDVLSAVQQFVLPKLSAMPQNTPPANGPLF